MLKSDNISELTKALAKFQGEVNNPHNESVNPQYKSRYAALDVVINTVKPVLAKHGLSFIQSTSTDGENVGITTLLMHESGEWIQSDTMFLPAYQIKGGGVKEHNSQAIGSSITYGRRYQLSAILGISSEDDDDANGQVFGDSKGPYGAQSNVQSNNKGNGASATTSAPSARDKAIEAAKQKAQMEAEAKGERDAAETPASSSSGSSVVEPVNEGQLKAIGNMVKIISKKRGWKDGSAEVQEFIKSVSSKYGKGVLEELSFEEGKLIVADLNGEMRK